MRKYRSLKLLKKHRKALRLKIIAVFLIILLSVILLSLASKVEGLSIRNIKIIGNDTLPTQEIRNQVIKELRGDYWGLFSRSNILIYPQGKIYQNLTDKFKRIKKAQIEFKSLNSIDIEIEERLPVVVWCSQKDDCYFADDTGYIFDKAPAFSGNVYFKYYGNLKESLKNFVGERFLKSIQFKKNNEFLNKLKKEGLFFKQLVILDSGDYELNFLKGGKIIFNPSQNFDLLLENLQTVLNSKELQNKKFEYIDLRFGNRVFFK